MQDNGAPPNMPPPAAGACHGQQKAPPERGAGLPRKMTSVLNQKFAASNIECKDEIALNLWRRTLPGLNQTRRSPDSLTKSRVHPSGAQVVRM
jgi:hypothetical protein